MTAVVYGKFARFDAPPRDFGPLPAKEPLPDEFSPTPRRRRSTVCENLTVNGERWAYSDSEEGARSKEIRAAIGYRSGADIRCAQRPGVQIDGDYAEDVCFSSYCRECPFRQAKPAPKPLPPMDEQPGWLLIDRVRFAMQTRNISHVQAARAIGRPITTVGNTLRGTRIDPAMLRAVARYLGVAW